MLDERARPVAAGAMRPAVAETTPHADRAGQPAFAFAVGALFRSRSHSPHHLSTFRMLPFGSTVKWQYCESRQNGENWLMGLTSASLAAVLVVAFASTASADPRCSIEAHEAALELVRLQAVTGDRSYTQAPWASACSLAWQKAYADTLNAVSAILAALAPAPPPKPAPTDGVPSAIAAYAAPPVPAPLPPVATTAPGTPAVLGALAAGLKGFADGMQRPATQPVQCVTRRNGQQSYTTCR